jgi:uncharacterized protein
LGDQAHERGSKQPWSICRPLAERGHPRALNAMGVLAYGEGDHKRAEQWFRKAAAFGYAPAIGNVGHMLIKRGKSDEAESWFRSAADAGHTPAL